MPGYALLILGTATKSGKILKRASDVFAWRQGTTVIDDFLICHGVTPRPAWGPHTVTGDTLRLALRPPDDLS